MTTTLRPGVYTSYTVSGGVRGSGRGAVGIAAAASKGEAGKAVLITGEAEAREAFGGGNLTGLISILLENGAGAVYACPVTGNDYDSAFAALMEVAEVGFMVCDSRSAAVHAKLAAAIAGGDERSKYRIAAVETAETEAGKIVEAAQTLNSERVLMVSHHETGGLPGSVAAAICALMSAQDDPALPLNGCVLSGLGDIGGNFSDSAVETLIAGGVTPLETLGGQVSVIRAVSTRTKTGGVADPTWREINTAMIVDTVIPAIRDDLRRSFARAKNTAQTRGAIRTRAVIALEEYQRREIIDSYANVRAEALADDPTVCALSFDFTVAHGLNAIDLSASITV